MKVLLSRLGHRLAAHRNTWLAVALIATGWFARDAWTWANTVDAVESGDLSYDRDTVLRIGSEGLYVRVDKMDTYSMVMAGNLEAAALQSLVYETLGKSDVRKIFYYQRLHDCLRDVERAKVNMGRAMAGGGTAWALCGSSPDLFLRGFVSRMHAPDPFFERPSTLPSGFGQRQRKALESMCQVCLKHAATRELDGRKEITTAVDELRGAYQYLLNTVDDLPLAEAAEVLDYAFPISPDGSPRMPDVGGEEGK